MEADSSLAPWRSEHGVDARQPDRQLAELLEGVLAALAKYVVFRGESQSAACALWVAHTWVSDRAETTPYLAVMSPERRCGKTRLLDVLELLVRDPWRVVTPSEAVVFRKLDADHPTLLLDEVDTIYGPRAPVAYEGLRAMLNAGHRAGTRVPRCVGEGANLRVQDFDVYSPKALAGIGDLPDTVADRSILIRLARRAPGEPVARFRRRDAEAELADLRLALDEWAAGVSGLEGDRPDVPNELDDRAADSWEPLLALADRSGGPWPQRARAAAVALSAGRNDDDASFGIRLLADCRTVFGDADRLATHQLVKLLAALEESPWADFHGHQVTPRHLARLLDPYDVHPRKVRLGDATAKGYLREEFYDAWLRYLPTPLRPEKVQQGEHGEQHTRSPVPDVPDVPPAREGRGAPDGPDDLHYGKPVEDRFDSSLLTTATSPTDDGRPAP